MAVLLNLSNDSVRWRWDGEDGEFIEGTKPSSSLRSKLSTKHRNRKGEINFIPYTIELCARTTDNWGGFVDTDTDKEVPYDASLRQAFFEALSTQSTTILNEVVEAMQETKRVEHDDLEDADPLP